MCTELTLPLARKVQCFMFCSHQNSCASVENVFLNEPQTNVLMLMSIALFQFQRSAADQVHMSSKFQTLASELDDQGKYTILGPASFQMHMV